MDVFAAFATDFDGTLLRSDGSFSEEDLNSLENLRNFGCAVILATGRSAFSLNRCLRGRSLPVDRFVLSSGGGILDGKGKTISYKTLSPEETLRIHSVFSSMGIEDISIQGPFPHNHKLHWIPGSHGEDFRRRLELYRGHSMEIDNAEMPSSEVIGFVEPNVAENFIEKISDSLGPDYSVIRATSPIDHSTVWVEVFPRGVNKGSACEGIRRELGIEPSKTAAVGNDWNDVHMLRWASAAFLVENSPAELKKDRVTVPSCDSNGVARAAEIWLEMLS